jgi:hypothetical protein
VKDVVHRIAADGSEKGKGMLKNWDLSIAVLYLLKRMMIPGWLLKR